MSEEMLARLLKLADEQQKPGSIPANVCLLFKMCDGSAKMLVRMVQTDNPKGDYITKPWEGTSEDIVVVRKNADGTLHYFLTDKTRKLRAAILAENGTSRLVLNETLAPSFEATMAHLAKEAADLPLPALRSPPPAAKLSSRKRKAGHTRGPPFSFVIRGVYSRHARLSPNLHPFIRFFLRTR
ncbi:MAG: hypothetical protein M0D55_00350 [Elusimicrobiota bacterium]|nr:MAG: hypothetical protein M0D55_00350 [Elusimicrobiota bacterium]